MTLQQYTSKEVSEVNEFIISSLQDVKEPGLAVAIVKDGEVLLSQGFGKRNVAENLEVTEQTLFGIASCSKAFTAMSLAMLEERNHFSCKASFSTNMEGVIDKFSITLEGPGSKPIIFERATVAHEPHKEN